MNLYILDNLLRRISIVDDFESLIWNEKFSFFGDVEIVIFSDASNRDLFRPNTMLAIDGSYRIMVVETILDSDDADGKSTLTIRGRSLEKVLLDRVARRNMNGLTAEPKWVITDTPANIVRYIFNYICVNGSVDVNDKIPFYYIGSHYPPGNIAEPSAVITVELEPTTVYDAIKEICDTFGLGFRFTHFGNDSHVRFDIYAGNDRTSAQTSLSQVIFSPDLDNLKSASVIQSTEQYKNVAYVLAPNGSRKVYSPEIEASVSGFDRRVLTVSATDITDAAGATLQAKLEQRGQDELSKNRNRYALDGELSLFNKYVYDKDYNLGDIIEVRNDDGVVSRMRIIEQIFVADAQGDRTYPTLAADTLIDPGSWAAWDASQTWENAVGDWDSA